LFFLVLCLAVGAGAAEGDQDKPARTATLDSWTVTATKIEGDPDTVPVTVHSISRKEAAGCYFCQRLAVLHDGRIVEEAAVRDFLKKPKHLYSLRLLSLIQKTAERFQSDDHPRQPSKIDPDLA
jgi:hypothetical protein